MPGGLRSGRAIARLRQLGQNLERLSGGGSGERSTQLLGQL
jgi:hypothetical protein